jgi:peptidyl-prolyl cis-trans isomerase A (cyclophilin A)
MNRRHALPLLLLCLAAPAVAQDAAPPAPAAPTAPKPATVRVSLETGEGVIVLELEKERAPITTANFLRYLDQKRLDGATFYRATIVAPGYGLIQGGARNNPKRALPPIAHEPTTKTGLSHVDGTISMARGAPGTASGDFFITVGTMPSLDADPKQPGDNQGFAAFGHVVEGMDVVRKILGDPTSPTEGEGVMKGQMLSPQVKIVAAKRVPNP